MFCSLLLRACTTQLTRANQPINGPGIRWVHKRAAWELAYWGADSAPKHWDEAPRIGKAIPNRNIVLTSGDAISRPANRDAWRRRLCRCWRRRRRRGRQLAPRVTTEKITLWQKYHKVNNRKMSHYLPLPLPLRNHPLRNQPRR